MLVPALHARATSALVSSTWPRLLSEGRRGAGARPARGSSRLQIAAWPATPSSNEVHTRPTRTCWPNLAVQCARLSGTLAAPLPHCSTLPSPRLTSSRLTCCSAAASSCSRCRRRVPSRSATPRSRSRSRWHSSSSCPMRCTAAPAGRWGGVGWGWRVASRKHA